MVFTALSKRKMLTRATSGNIQCPGCFLNTQGKGVLSLAHASLVKYFDFQQWCDSNFCWVYSVQVTGSEIGMAPKCLPSTPESPYNFRLESAMSIILDRNFLLKENLWLTILTGWATGVNGLIMSFLGLITSFLGGMKSRGKLEKRDWRKADTIHVKRK